MTFKHIQFQDSPTMRALERIAQEKGLVKPETIQKTASTKKTPNTVPSSNLMENILKLCDGLRSQGLQKEAAELETNYLNYKRAQTLYETSKERGEDLVHSAHPEGSHKLENVAGEEATFEDILDQHVKIMQVMDKRPHGKLTNANMIIAEVKKALGQDAQKAPTKPDPDLSKVSYEQLERQIATNVPRAVSAVASVGPIIKDEMTVFADYTRKLDAIKEASKSTGLDGLMEMSKQIDYLMTRIKPGSWVTMGLGGITENTWATVEPTLLGAKRLVNSAIAARKELNQRSGAAITKSFEDETEDKPFQVGEVKVTPGPLTEGPLAPLFQQLDELQSKVNSWKAIDRIANSPDATRWIDKEVVALDKISQRYRRIPVGQDANMVPNMQKEINAQVVDINEFESDWVK